MMAFQGKRELIDSMSRSDDSFSEMIPMKSKRVSTMLLTLIMIKAILSGAHSHDPFDPVQKFLLDMESDS